MVSEQLLTPSHNMIFSTLTANGVRTCLDYKHHLNASRLRVGPVPANPLSKWSEYQSEQSNLTSSRNTISHPHHTPHLPTNDTVSMPAGALEAIIRAVGNTNQPKPPPTPKPVSYPKLFYCPPPPQYINHGKGNYRGKGKGKGGGNRRQKCSEVTKDPYHNQNNNQPSLATPSPIIGSTPVPVTGPSTVLVPIVSSMDTIFNISDSVRISPFPTLSHKRSDIPMMSLEHLSYFSLPFP